MHFHGMKQIARVSMSHLDDLASTNIKLDDSYYLSGYLAQVSGCSDIGFVFLICARDTVTVKIIKFIKFW